jgi:hypothetical protein
MQSVSALVDKGWERQHKLLSPNPMLNASGFVVSRSLCLSSYSSPGIKNIKELSWSEGVTNSAKLEPVKNLNRSIGEPDMKQQYKLSFSIFLVSLILIALVASVSARIDSSQTVFFPDQRDSAAAAVTWLYQVNQSSDGGFGTDFMTGLPSSSLESTLDAMIAISSTGYNPGAVYFNAQKSAVNYLEDNAADLVSFATVGGGSNAKVIIALASANLNARDFVGHDYVAQLTAQYEVSGSYNNTTAYNQALSINALVQVGEPVPAQALQWLEDLQADDGSWDDGFGTAQNPDTTSMAIMALLAGGRSTADVSVADGLDFLADSQLSSGGWEYGVGFGENANSTALAVQALSAAGENFYASTGPWVKNGISPLMALLSWQNTTGAYQADFGQGRADNFYATVQSIPASVGKPYPLASRYEAAQIGLICLAGLQDVSTGGWEQFAGVGINAAGTSRAIEAIAAAGDDPQSAAWTPGSINAVEALENETPDYLTEGKGGRGGIVTQGVVAAGSPYDPADFADYDLPDYIAGFLNEDGEYADTSFGIVAQSEAMLGLLLTGNEVAPSAVNVVLDSQTNGDWGSPDNNGIALNVLGRLGIQFKPGIDNLMATQQADAGWGFGGDADPSATSEVVQGLVEQGENPFSPQWSQVIDGLVTNPADVIMNQQTENGCWPNLYGPGDDPFGTTDAIILLAQEPDFQTYTQYAPVVLGK